MLTLLSECHFWTTHDEIRIKSTDYGAYKYYTKRDFDIKNLSIQSKKEYAEKRDGKIVITNRKPNRLKDTLRKLEELLKLFKVVHCEWRDAAAVQIMFSNGILAHICINMYTGDIAKMAFDKYFVGKLASDVVTDAIFTRQHILLSYNTNQITVVYLQKPNMRRSGPEKITNMDPKIFHVLIPGPSERKLSRNLVVNNSFDLIIVWTKSSQNEVYPWRPTIRDQDRANIHVFKLRSAKLEPVAYCWTENDPICVEFLRASDGQMMTVEQKVSRKGEITAEICSYEIGQAKMQRVATTSIPIGTQICCYSFSPDQEKLVLGTIDRYVCVHDLVRKVTKFAPKTDIIPTHCAWHPDSGVIMIANDRSQFQCLDLSLSFVANQIISEDVTPSNLHDLSHYFAIQPTLLKISFSCKADLNNFGDRYAQTDCFLLLIFENGPIGSIRFFAGTGMTGDVHNSGLTPDVLVNKYLAINHIEKAVNVLLALNWETYGAMCLVSLHKISSFVFTRNDAKRSRNDLLHRALQSFTDELSDETKDEFGDQVIDLKRRYFVYLLRHKLYPEAFEIAKNIEDYDLFMDLFNVTKIDGKLHNFARESYRQAETILNQNDSTNGTTATTTPIASAIPHGAGDTISISSCSHSSCSECVKADRKIGKTLTNNAPTSATAHHSQLLTVKRFQKYRGYDGGSNFKNYVPPLPYFKSKVFNAENIKINIPKPELRIDGQSTLLPPQPLRNPPIPPRLECNPLPAASAQQPLLSNRFMNNFRNSYTDQIAHYNQNPNGNNAYQMMDPIGLWSQVPDQTLGIPVAVNQIKPSASTSLLSTASSSYSLLPRASTSASNSSNYMHHQQQQHHHQHHHHQMHDFPPMINNNNNNNHQQKLMKSESLYNLPKFYQHPLVSGTIPASMLVLTQSSTATTTPLPPDDMVYRATKKPATSILSNSSSNMTNYANGGGGNGAINSVTTSSSNISNKKDSGEKNKVKFSDTVQVAVVPEIPRKEKSLPPKRNGFRPLLTDPQKELADSLPLCHPNDDYLKDFNPVQETDTTPSDTLSGDGEQNSNRRSPPTIKVVHFGVV